MKPTRFVISSLITALMLISFTPDEPGKINEQVIIEIDYNTFKPKKSLFVIWEEGLTALEALQKTAQVETYAVNAHVIVTAIDDVKSRKGETAWYYHVNGKPADKLAIKKIVNPGDTISWIYKKDVCSKK